MTEGFEEDFRFVDSFLLFSNASTLDPTDSDIDFRHRRLQSVVIKNTQIEIDEQEVLR
jgi:hypothetical protein